MTAPTVSRKIIHIDMDAFYASVEQRNNPALRGKPVAVGGSEKRGVVAAASYEARKFGVHSAMPSVRAAKLCPDIIFVHPRFDVYKQVSHKIRDVFREYTEIIEPLSLDEAYLDVSRPGQDEGYEIRIAREIKTKIRETVDLTASAGISYNKFLAKIASDMDKPDGLYVISEDEAEDFLARLPIKKFHGIGSKTAEKMRNAGIFTGADLRKRSLEDLAQRYGKMGTYYFDICRGIDNRPVQPNRERKSISAENTFDVDLMKMDQVRSKVDPIIIEVFKRYTRGTNKGRTVTVKIKYGDFEQITRSHTLEHPVESEDGLRKEVLKLLNPSILRDEGIRLLGVGISNFAEEKTDQDKQLSLDF